MASMACSSQFQEAGDEYKHTTKLSDGLLGRYKILSCLLFCASRARPSKTYDKTYDLVSYAAFALLALGSFLKRVLRKI